MSQHDVRASPAFALIAEIVPFAHLQKFHQCRYKYCLECDFFNVDAFLKDEAEYGEADAEHDY